MKIRMDVALARRKRSRQRALRTGLKRGQGDQTVLDWGNKVGGDLGEGGGQVKKEKTADVGGSGSGGAWEDREVGDGGVMTENVKLEMLTDEAIVDQTVLDEGSMIEGNLGGTSSEALDDVEGHWGGADHGRKRQG